MLFYPALIRLSVVLTVFLSSACVSVPQLPESSENAPNALGAETRIVTAVESQIEPQDEHHIPSVQTAHSVQIPTEIAPTSYYSPTASSQYECANRLPIKNRIGQLMFPLITLLDFADAQQMNSEGLLGGVVVLGSPSASIRDAISIFQKRSLYGPSIVAVDEEGGRVQRLAKLTSRIPSARKVANTKTLSEARRLAADHADAIGNLGFTMNLAPVADIDFGGAMGDRSYGNDAAAVTDFALATAEGILDAGLVPVLKHFPGHGRGTDSHISLPVIPSVEVLHKGDLLPFISVSHRKDVPIMVGHLVVDGLTQGQPASISKEAIDGLLRNELGFDGLVMTDAFNMSAISFNLSDAEAAERSIAAGVDLVMLSSVRDVIPSVDRVVEAVEAGRISEESVNESFLRVMHTRTIDICELSGYH